MRTLGRDLRVSSIGLGCMGMSEFYGPHDDEQSMATLNRALDLGVTFLDTADMYGHGHNEKLVAYLLRERGRDAVTLATKFGIVREDAGYARRIDNSPDYVRSACEGSLKRLGTDHIDLYYIHRVERDRPIEEAMEALSRLVRDGKIGHIGICEVRSETLRRAHAVHPISALQTEFSLWSREPEGDVLATCRELGIGFVPYAPLGRGFLTGKLSSTDGLADDDFRKTNPRFEDKSLSANLAIVRAVHAMAEEKQCTPGQLALAWLLAQGDDIVPIPGTKRTRYLEENANAIFVELNPEDLRRLDEAVPPGVAQGQRYTAEGMKGVNV
jgi:aryl-alcohol dehydrogenase-like predicted oxidoreductase